jgi:hypothetical protein
MLVLSTPARAASTKHLPWCGRTGDHYINGNGKLLCQPKAHGDGIGSFVLLLAAITLEVHMTASPGGEAVQGRRPRP